MRKEYVEDEQEPLDACSGPCERDTDFYGMVSFLLFALEGRKIGFRSLSLSQTLLDALFSSLPLSVSFVDFSPKGCSSIVSQNVRALPHPRPDVDGLGVGHGWQLRVDARRLRGHGEECGDAERDPRRDGVLVEPEGDPGDDDQHAARHVDGDQVVGELALEDQLHLQAAVLSCKGIEGIP